MEKIYKFFLTALCLAALSLSSCTKDGGELDTAVSSTKTFRATTETASRTTLDGNLNVIWSEGDEIVVFGITDAENNRGSYFSLSEGAGTTDAVFSGSLDKEYSDYYAVYPASTFNGITVSGRFTINLPYQSVFTQNNFVDNANVMVAYGTDNGQLKFRNILGIVEFQITGQDRKISKIEVITSENKALSGQFYLYPKTLALDLVSGNGERAIMAELAEPIDFAAEPGKTFSIYALLPPETYSNLTVRLTDELGNIATYTAKNDITVTRSHITPVSKFDYKGETIPYATVSIYKERTTFEATELLFSRNDKSAGFKWNVLEKAEYDALAAQYGSDLEILLKSATTKSDTNTRAILTRYNYGKVIDYVALVAAYDEQGQILQTANKLEFTTLPIPQTDAYSVDVVGEPTENAVDLTFTSTGAYAYYLMYRIFTDSEIDNIVETGSSVEFNSLAYGVFATSYSPEYKVNHPNLLPDTRYTVVYTISREDKIIGTSYLYANYATIKRYEFTTPAHAASEATVSFTEENVGDWNATVRMQPSEGVTKIKYLLATEQSDEYTADYVALNGIEVMYDESSPTIELEGLKEETSYYLYGVAYNAEDSYGQVSAPLKLTTTPLIPVQDDRYSEFLGEYTMSITGSGNGDTSRDVTIAQGVEGKTFLVKGLIYTDTTAQYGFDDTVIATYKDGKIRFNCQILKSHGSLPADIQMLVYNGMYLWYNPAFGLESTYNDGIIRPLGISSGEEWRGLLFRVNNSYLDYYDNITLTKKGVVIPVIGSYTMTDSTYGSTNTFTVASGAEKGQYIVSSFCLNGSDDLQWYASYDENAGTFTVSGQVVGLENNPCLFEYYYGFYTYAGYYPIWYSSVGDGSTGKDRPCVFAVDPDTKKISALTTNLQVNAIDDNGKVLGYFVIFKAESTTVAPVSAAASLSAAGKAAMPTVQKSSMPLGASSARVVDASRKSSVSREIRNYADVIGR